MTWNETFVEMFDRWVGAYRGGQRDFTRYDSGADAQFLAGIGYQPRELFDFVEDFCDEGEPSPSTALLVAAVRRDFFLTVQGGRRSEALRVTAADLPNFGAELEGIGYLPRILAKARAKLRGELDPDLMFCCGGDRNFLLRHGGIHPADFLRHVWAARDDDGKVAAWVRMQE